MNSHNNDHRCRIQYNQNSWSTRWFVNRITSNFSFLVCFFFQFFTHTICPHTHIRVQHSPEDGQKKLIETSLFIMFIGHLILRSTTTHRRDFLHGVTHVLSIIAIQRSKLINNLDFLKWCKDFNIIPHSTLKPSQPYMHISSHTAESSILQKTVRAHWLKRRAEQTGSSQSHHYSQITEISYTASPQTLLTNSIFLYAEFQILSSFEFV